MRDTLKLITYNTWKCDGDYLLRLQLMQEQLAPLRPDILLLQEAYAEIDGGHSTAVSLARALDMQLDYLPARFNMRKAAGRRRGSWSGMALLSRLPVTSHDRLLLPTHPDDGERVAQLAVLTVGDHRLLVINAHLTYLPAADATRIAQLRTLLNHPWLGEPYAAVLLCGDLNASPESAAMTWLRTRSGWRVTDLYQHLHPGRPRASILADRQAYAGAALGPNVDYVLLLEDRWPAELQPLSAAYVLDRPARSGHYPSDHFALQVEFRLRRAP